MAKSNTKQTSGIRARCGSASSPSEGHNWDRSIANDALVLKAKDRLGRWVPKNSLRNFEGIEVAGRDSHIRRGKRGG